MPLPATLDCMRTPGMTGVLQIDHLDVSFRALLQPPQLTVQRIVERPWL